jgi:hypothetical protein
MAEPHASTAPHRFRQRAAPRCSERRTRKSHSRAPELRADAGVASSMTPALLTTPRWLWRARWASLFQNVTSTFRTVNSLTHEISRTACAMHWSCAALGGVDTTVTVTAAPS